MRFEGAERWQRRTDTDFRDGENSHFNVRPTYHSYFNALIHQRGLAGVTTGYVAFVYRRASAIKKVNRERWT